MAAPTSSHPTSSPWVAQAHCDILEFDDDEVDTSALHSRFIDPTTTQRLLSLPKQHQQSSTITTTSSITPPVSSHARNNEHDDVASALLSSLTRLAPTVAKDFTTKPSTTSALQFRLIHDVDDLPGEEESYIALSYVWKDARHDIPRKLVSPVGELPFGWVRTVEQFPLPISRGVFMGVLGERRMGEGLWFDQVCIEMGDEEERANARAWMGDIYSRAREVVVALDDVVAPPEEVLFLERYMQQYTYSDLSRENRGLYPPFMQQQPLFWSFLDRVLGSMWFERAWCAMEMRMARRHVFLVPCLRHYGDEEEDEEGVWTLVRFTGEFFAHMLRLASELSVGSISLGRQTRIQTLLQHFGARSSSTSIIITSPESTQHSLGSISISTSPASLIPTISTIFPLHASGNPSLPPYLRRLDANRDKVSIILNTCDIPLALKPRTAFQRPDIEDECLRQLLLLGLAARDPAALCTLGAPLRLCDGSVSWLCRPTSLDVPEPIPSSFNTTARTSDQTHVQVKDTSVSAWETITQGSDGRAEYVELSFQFLELPHRMQPNPYFATHVHRACEFIDICTTYSLRTTIPTLRAPSTSTTAAQAEVWNAWHAAPNHPRGPALRNVFIQTLACAFDCGPSWFLDLSSQLALQLPPPPAHTTSPLEPPSPHILEALFTPQIPLQHSIQHPSAFHALTSVLNVLALLITRGIPWASGASECSHGPMIVTAPSPSASASSSASAVNNKAIIFAPFAHSKTLLVAVPDVVKGAEYTGLARAWILTPNNPFTGGHSAKGLVSWVLRGKGVIFGESGFVGGLDEGEKKAVRRHRVYGPSGGE
ncbi:hypothetical protein CC80DRAFT_411532 [Byssothecium circinans]|uniref:Heterokaryon incompatibility domain-containing protein n=1 Tax=Byssothecium circinans TaxID=147558 RepID=A0A6A5TZC0_9PLEO|nr:hypothetical protein CC80DRAFT_411532 [Byssothecium circinans]